MALDSKQKRGSAINLGSPDRQWLTNPDGTIGNTERVSLVKLASGVAPASPPTTSVAAKLYHLRMQGIA